MTFVDLSVILKYWENSQINFKGEMVTMNSTKHETLANSLRSYLRSLANRRSEGTVTADDAQKYLTRKGVREQMIRTRQSLINSAFQSGDFAPVGSVPSSRPAARGREITEWMLA